MRLERLATCLGFTILGGWLMTDENAHITEELRARMATRVAKASDRAVMREFETGTGKEEVWFWSKMIQRLGCRICMALEWSALAWWATRPKGSKTGPVRMLVEIGAINGLHILVTKLTEPGIIETEIILEEEDA